MTTTPTDKLPPDSPDAERGILGCVLLDGQPASELRPDWFYDPRHRELADCILEMARHHQPINMLTVRAALKDKQKLDAVGDAYLSALPAAGVAPAMYSHWRTILEDKLKLRLVIKTASECTARAYESNANAADVLDAFERDALAIRRNFGSDAHEANNKALLHELTNEWEAAVTGEKLTGIRTGYYDLDRLIGGLRPQQLIVLAARPSVGKTALALNIAEHVAVDHGISVAFFSLEMSAKELLQRLVCGRARVDSTRLNEGQPTEQDIRKLSVAQAALANAPLCIVDKGALTIAQLTGLGRRMVHQHALKLIVVDYLGLLRSGEKNRTRYEEVTLISNGLKMLAKELAVPVIALAQLNRDSDRENRAPRLSDLRDSGAIEQDADIVALLHRNEDQTGDTHTVDLVLAKHRNGRTGRVELMFQRVFTRFDSAAFHGVITGTMTTT